MTVALPQLPKRWQQIRFTGQRVTVEKGGPTGYVVTAWGKGLPIARKPISHELLKVTLEKWPHTFA